jgi:catechol 2,3-dioxygenase-like lactoylglutathione lyase family enzyme
MTITTEFLSAVLIYSEHPDRLAKFYREALGFPLKEERHGNSELHYGCELGDVHFAIHRSEDGKLAPGGVRLAFVVFDMAAFVAQLKNAGVHLLYEPQDVGFAIMTALEDPDGNPIEFTQLSPSWFDHLQRRREAGHDVLLRRRNSQVR